VHQADTTQTQSFRRCSLYIGATGLYIYYFQLELQGKLMGNFDLVAVIPTPSSSTRMMYRQTGQTDLKIVDGRTNFKNVLPSFGSQSKFNYNANIFPNFPTDTEVLLSFTVGSVVLKAYMALVIDVEVTGSNVFTAQAGAYANAQTKVALFAFEKLSDTCSDGYVHSASICNQVLSDAGVTQSQISSCTSPSSASISGTCVTLSTTSKYLIIQVFERPTFKSGLNGPSLKANNSNPLTITLSVYPIAKVSAYNGMFSLYAAPQIKAVVNANTGGQGTKCADKVAIEVRALLQLLFCYMNKRVFANHIN
jgi:hypothetical protein